MATETLELKVGQKFGAGQQYEIRDKAEIDKRKEDSRQDAVAAPLGKGGAGAVYFALQNGKIERAVKFLNPDESVFRNSSQFIRYRQTFENEINLLIDVRHPNISSIVDYGELTVEGSICPYYVMNLVRGQPLDRFIKEHAESIDSKVLCSLLSDLFAALSYLHSAKIMHCDVKEGNLLIDTKHQSRPTLQLVDLGVAHAIKSDDTLTMVAGTRRRMPKAIVDKLGTQSYAHIPRREFEGWYPVLDLHLVGKMLDGLFFTPNRDENQVLNKTLRVRLEKRLGATTWNFLRSMAARLQIDNGFQQEESIRTAEQAINELHKLDPEYRVPYGVEELAHAGKGRISIQLPRGRSVLSERLYRVVEHPIFQRLREYNQLNFVYMIYPGARHSRFVHSLRAYDLARDYLAALLAETSFLPFVAQPDLEAVLIWALIHDIGHYPLSHMFEGICSARSLEEVAAGGPAMDGAFFQLVLEASCGTQETSFYKGKNVEAISGALREKFTTMPSLLQVIEDGFGRATVDALRELTSQSHSRRGVSSILRALVDGPLDVDKLSYLECDSMHSGAPYGAVIDHDALLKSIAFSADPMQIGVKVKAISAVEAVLTARQWMFARVYWHKMNRAIMAMFRRAIHMLFSPENAPLSFSDYLQKMFFATDIEATRFLAEHYKKHQNSDLLYGLLDGRRDVHHCAFEVSENDINESWSIPGLRWQQLERKFETPQNICDFENKLMQKASVQLNPKPQSPDWILVDLPKEDRSPQDSIMIFNGKQGTPLRQHSRVARELKSAYNDNLRKFRIYVDHKIYLHYENQGETSKLEDIIQSALRAVLVIRE